MRLHALHAPLSGSLCGVLQTQTARQSMQAKCGRMSAESASMSAISVEAGIR